MCLTRNIHCTAYHHNHTSVSLKEKPKITYEDVNGERGEEEERRREGGLSSILGYSVIYSIGFAPSLSITPFQHRLTAAGTNSNADLPLSLPRFN